MKPALLLRISSIVSLLLAAGHTVGGTKSWSPMGDNEVFRAMSSVHFVTEGVNRTYLDFYLGFGYIISAYLLLQAVLLWQLAAIAKTDPLQTRPLVASLFLAAVANAALSWVYLFSVPAIFSTVIALFLALAFYATGKFSVAAA